MLQKLGAMVLTEVRNFLSVYLVQETMYRITYKNSEVRNGISSG